MNKKKLIINKNNKIVRVVFKYIDFCKHDNKIILSTDRTTLKEQAPVCMSAFFFHRICRPNLRNGPK